MEDFSGRVAYLLDLGLHPCHQNLGHHSYHQHLVHLGMFGREGSISCGGNLNCVCKILPVCTATETYYRVICFVYMHIWFVDSLTSWTWITEVSSVHKEKVEFYWKGGS